MDKPDFQDRQLEELLTKMPKMKDRRSQNEIYQVIHIGGKQKHKKEKSFLIPTLTTAALLIICILISPFFIQDRHKELSSSSKMSADTQQKRDQSNQPQEEMSLMKSAEKQNDRTAVYQHDLENHDVITYGLFTKDAFLLPVSIVVPKTKSNWLSKYKETIRKVPLEQWGFSNIPQLQGNIHYDEKNRKVQIILKKEEWGRIPESVSLNLDKMIQYSFAAQNVDEVEFSDGKGNPVQIANIGELRTVKVKSTPKTGYYGYEIKDKENWLIPSDSEFNTLDDALNGMKEKPNDFFSPIIPKNLDIVIQTETPKQVDIEFNHKVNLLENKEHMEMIEGILLTAKNFGYSTVQFRNLEPSEWNGFNFQEPIEVPYSANRIDINK